MKHVDGTPFRKLGDQYDLSAKQIYRRVEKEINQLPSNDQLTKELCDSSRFSKILIIDGKYVKTRPFEQKIPLIYGIDYSSHDIPLGQLSVSEDQQSFSVFFTKLQQLSYWPKVIVADDRGGLKTALNKVFPHTLLQLCHVHYLENIRGLLKIRTDQTYQHFFNSLRLHVFNKPRDVGEVESGLRHVLINHAQGKPLLENIISDIYQRREELFNYFKIKDCPNNINLIELYNSHLQARLKSIKGFKSFESAALWLNAYLIRRRTKPLTDCKQKFKHLNRHSSLSRTIKKQAPWPIQLKRLGINKIKYYNFIEISG